jgi:hypothetical protein
LRSLDAELAQVGASLGSRALVDEYMHRFGLDKSLPEPRPGRAAGVPSYWYRDLCQPEESA